MKRYIIIFLFMFMSGWGHAQISNCGFLDSIRVRQISQQQIELVISTFIGTGFNYKGGQIFLMNDTITVDLCFRIFSQGTGGYFHRQFTMPVEDNHQYTVTVRDYHYDYENDLCFEEGWSFSEYTFELTTPLESEIGIEVPHLAVPEKDYPDIALYPNPVQDKLYIRNNSPAEIRQLRLYNAQGRLYKQLAVPDIPYLSVADLPAGLYFVRLYTDSGILNKKILVRRD